MKIFNRKKKFSQSDKSENPNNIKTLREIAEINISSFQLKDYFEMIYDKITNYISLNALGIILFDFGEENRIERFMKGHNLFDIENALRKIMWIRDSEEMNSDSLVYIPDIQQKKPILKLNTHSLSQLCIPLRSGSKLFGVIIMESKKKRYFEGHRDFSKVFRTIMVSHLQNYYLQREIQTKKHVIFDNINLHKTLLNLSNQIDNTINIELFFKQIIQIIVHNLEFSDGFIFLEDDRKNYKIQSKSKNFHHQFSISKKKFQEIIDNSIKAGNFSFITQIEKSENNLEMSSSTQTASGNIYEILYSPFYNQNNDIVGFIGGFKRFKNNLPDTKEILLWEILANLCQIGIAFSDQNIANSFNDGSDKNERIKEYQSKIGDLQEQISILKFDLSQKQLELESSQSFNPNDRAFLKDQNHRTRGDFDLLHLYNLSLILNSTLNIDNILSIIAEQTLQITGTQSCKISIINPDTNKLITSFIFGASSKFGTNLAPDNGEELITDWILENDRLLVIPNLKKDKRFPDLSLLLETGIQSTLAIPMKMGGKTIGVLQTYGYAPTEFSDRDIRLLTVLSTEAAIAINNAQLLKETERMALTDELTGVYNYRYFYEQLRKLVNRKRVYPITLVMIDVDNLKVYNDTYGHLFGSRALKATATIIKKYIEETDIVAKYGGDEFSVIMPETSKEKAFTIVEKIRKSIQEYDFQTGENQNDGCLTISIGMAECPLDATEWQKLLNVADKELYRAKNTGRNKTCL